MNTELPSEKLARKPRRIRAVVIGAASLALIAGAALGVPAVVQAMAPAPRIVAAADPVPTAAPCEGTSYGQGICVTNDQQATANQQLAQLEADNAAKVKAAADVAAAAAAQAAVEQAARDSAVRKTAQPQTSTAPSPGASGSRVPFVASTDPNNANGGDYEDPGLFCQSHSASGNPPVCD